MLAIICVYHFYTVFEWLIITVGVREMRTIAVPSPRDRHSPDWPPWSVYLCFTCCPAAKMPSFTPGPKPLPVRCTGERLADGLRRREISMRSPSVGGQGRAGDPLAWDCVSPWFEFVEVLSMFFNSWDWTGNVGLVLLLPFLWLFPPCWDPPQWHYHIKVLILSHSFVPITIHF